MLRKWLRVLDDFGFASFGLTEADFIKSGNIIQMGYLQFCIDVLATIDGVDFENCYKNKMIDLIVNKQVGGRLKDLDDLENLKNSDQ